MGGERDISSAFGYVSDTGGDGSFETGVDDGGGDDVCSGVFQCNCIVYAEAVGGSSADIDVYADDSYVCNDSGFIFEGVFTGDERGIRAIRAVDNSELPDNRPGGGLRQPQTDQHQPGGRFGHGNRFYVCALRVGGDSRTSGGRGVVGDSNYATGFCALDGDEAAGGGVYNAGNSVRIKQSLFEEEVRSKKQEVRSKK